jgi:hypothetical protein
MRATICFGFLALLVACGPSSGAIRDAREARYNATPEVVWKETLAAVQETYQIDAQEQANGEIRTEAEVYERDGHHEDKNSDDNVMVQGGSVILAFHVAVRGAEGAYYIEVKPLAAEFVSGSPQPRPLEPDDPDMPGWVAGKVDNLYLAINARLKQHQVVMAPK